MDKDDLLKLELKETIRYLLLPLSEEKESEVIEEVIETYSSRYERNEISFILKDEIQDWQYGNKSSPDLKKIIAFALSKIDSKYSDSFSSSFFNLFDKMDTRISLEFNQKLVLISYIPLIIKLLDEYRMSCAKIASIINQFDNRLEYITWREIQVISSEFGIKPSLSQAEVAHITEIDRSYQNYLFADADINEASWIVGKKANELGFQEDLEKLLRTLANDTFYPYIQMLHYQMIISEFYDHRVSVIYEFSPRGDIPNWVFNLYSDVPTSNPFLNNAKAVDTLDKNWANSRKSNVEQAFALVNILSNIDLMNFNSSNELSGWIRRWIFRLLDLRNEISTKVEHVKDDKSITDIINKIISKETNTYGIIEQRIVDYLTKINHSESKWRPRGLKDSVHANNFSKRKLGDCDYQDSNKFEIYSYEAHAGTLTDNYLQSHIKTLPRIIERRKEELLTISDIENWNLEILFLAHSLKDEQIKEIEISGLKVKIIGTTYSDFIHQNSFEHSVDQFNSLVINVLNQRNTPNYVRGQFNTIINA